MLSAKLEQELAVDGRSAECNLHNDDDDDDDGFKGSQHTPYDDASVYEAWS